MGKNKLRRDAGAAYAEVLSALTVVFCHSAAKWAPKPRWTARASSFEVANCDPKELTVGGADQLWGNSNLYSSEFSAPVLGLIFLRFADHKLTQIEGALAKRAKAPQGRRKFGKTHYQAEGVLYLPDSARFSNLQKLPGVWASRLTTFRAGSHRKQCSLDVGSLVLLR